MRAFQLTYLPYHQKLSSVSDYDPHIFDLIHQYNAFDEDDEQSILSLQLNWLYHKLPTTTKIFELSCQFNNLEMMTRCRDVFSLSSKTDHYYYDNYIFNGLVGALKSQNMDTINWVLASQKNLQFNYSYLFTAASDTGKPQILRLILDRLPNLKTVCLDQIAHGSFTICRRHQTEMIKLYQEYQIFCLHQGIIGACAGGHVALLDELSSHHQLLPSLSRYELQQCIKYCGYSGNIQIFTILLNYYQPSTLNPIFMVGLKYGHPEFCQFLCSWARDHSSTNLIPLSTLEAGECFREACEGGHLKSVKLVLSMFYHDREENYVNTEGFQYACLHDRREMALFFLSRLHLQTDREFQWLLELSFSGGSLPLIEAVLEKITPQLMQGSWAINFDDILETICYHTKPTNKVMSIFFRLAGEKKWRFENEEIIKGVLSSSRLKMCYHYLKNHLCKSV